MVSLARQTVTPNTNTCILLVHKSHLETTVGVIGIPDAGHNNESQIRCSLGKRRDVLTKPKTKKIISMPKSE